MKLKSIFVISAICVSMFSGKALAAETNLKVSTNSDVRIMESKTEISRDKKWTVKFTKELNGASINKDNIQVLDKDNNVVDVTVSLNADKKSVDIVAPSSKYASGQTYSVVVNKNVMDKLNHTLTRNVKMSFTIVNSSTGGGSSSSGSSSINVDPAMIEASAGLGEIQAIVKTEAEKDLVKSLKAAVDAKIKNPLEVTDVASLKAKYHSLSAVEQGDFQTAVLSKFSLGTLFKIKSLFS